MAARFHPEWIEDCRKWRGRDLTGEFAHWCYDWDGLPVDETTAEWSACGCYTPMDFIRIGLRHPIIALMAWLRN